MDSRKRRDNDIEHNDDIEGALPPLDFTCAHCGAINQLPREQLLSMERSPRCGRCSNDLLSLFNSNFNQMPASAYIHPLDRETLDALNRIPGVTTLLRSLIKHSFELATRLHHHANFLQVGPKQLSEVWALFENAGTVLGLKELPELFVYQDPQPNAYTFGVEHHFVAVSTGALDLLEPPELEVLLAHELGHVHADHVLYKSAARVFGNSASTISQMTLGLGALVMGPIQVALLRWDRASELSSDRAALLVSKNPKVVIETLMKVAGGATRYASGLNVDAFIEQADAFGALQDEGPLGKYITIFQTLFRSHPFPIWRAKELLDWVREGNYLHILDGEYDRVVGASKICVACGSEKESFEQVCPYCGVQPEHLDHQESAPQAGHVNTGDSQVAKDESLLGQGEQLLSKTVSGAKSWLRQRLNDQMEALNSEDDERLRDELKIKNVIDVDATEDSTEENDCDESSMHEPKTDEKG